MSLYLTSRLVSSLGKGVNNILLKPQVSVCQPAKCRQIEQRRYAIVGAPDPMGPPPKRKNFRESLLPLEWHKLIDRYPDFLPDPLNNNPLQVSRQIEDMLQRRTVLEIPDFYVGSLVAVTVSDQYAETKRSRFMGICIQRTGRLLSSNFTLRNVIDGMGIEIRYELYNPLILSIEVIRLEKRLDDELIYLRDALPEYSTFPEDMKPEVLEDASEVPVNKLQVVMNPMPWSRRWERHLLRGVKQLDNIPELWAKRVKELEDDPTYKYDTMMEYRRHCTEEMMYNICKRLADHEKKVVHVREEARAKRFMQISKAPIAQSTVASRKAAEERGTSQS